MYPQVQTNGQVLQYVVLILLQEASEPTSATVDNHAEPFRAALDRSVQAYTKDHYPNGVVTVSVKFHLILLAIGVHSYIVHIAKYQIFKCVQFNMLSCACAQCYSWVLALPWYKPDSCLVKLLFKTCSAAADIESNPRC